MKFTTSAQRTLPLIVTRESADPPLAEVLRTHAADLTAALHDCGGVLFRGYGVTDPHEFEAAARELCPELVADNGEHQRTGVLGNVFTPVKYPANEKLLWHNENSFNVEWPTKIFFACAVPAVTGGETPLVDSRKVYRTVDPALRDRFEARGVMYVRNFVRGLAQDWEQIYQVGTKGEAEAYCRRNKIAFEWDGEVLKTRSVRPSVLAHATTGEKSWFNQATHWHPACLSADRRARLLRVFDKNDLPRHCHFGDGSPIEDSMMDEIMGVYQELEVAFPWEGGDMLLVDNVLTAHARNAYTGERKLLVTMGDVSRYAL
jgi:hypothetical protein